MPATDPVTGVADVIDRLRRLPPAELLAGGTMTVEMIIAEYGIGRTSIYEIMTAGLPFTRVNNRRLIPRRAIIELLAAGLSGNGLG